MPPSRPRRDETDIPVAETVAELRAACAAFRAAGDRIGLVPTMGALHEGHLSLVRRARSECRRVVVSIFVNPSQFGPNEDFARYPRRLADDRAALAGEGADLVFQPTAAEMYPEGFQTTVSVAGLADGLCGAARPGHFAGVATVVSKLLLQCLPDAAYFGEKDYQQLLVIRRMTRDLDIPVAIEGVPILRETDGLALSSRNAFLSAGQREIAGALPRILAAAAERLAVGEPASGVLATAEAALLAAGFAAVDYVALCDAGTLAPLDRADRPARLLAAAHIGETRLIDNLAVTAGGR